MVSWWIDTGEPSREDIETWHFLEHLLLREMRAACPPDFLFHAETGEGWMFFRCAVLPEGLFEALEKIALVSFRPALAQKDIEAESLVIAHEIRRAVPPPDRSALLDFYFRHLAPEAIHIAVFSPNADSGTLARASAIVDSLAPARAERFSASRTEQVPASPFCPDVAAENPSNPPSDFSCTWTGPRPRRGELPYFQLAPALLASWMDPKVRVSQKWESGWRIRRDAGEMHFRGRGDRAEKLSHSLARALELSLAEPPRPQIWKTAKKQMLRHYHLAHDGQEEKAFALGRAASGGYLFDALEYPALWERIRAVDFWDWWKSHCARSRFPSEFPISVPAAPGEPDIVRQADCLPNFSAYLRCPEKFDYTELPLGPDRRAVLVRAENQANCTAAFFLPLSGKAPGHAVFHDLLVEETRRVSGKLLWEKTEEYYLAAVLVWGPDFSDFIEGLEEKVPDVRNPEGNLAFDGGGKWRELQRKIREAAPAAPSVSVRSVLVLSGDRSAEYLADCARSLDRTLRGIPHSSAARTASAEGTATGADFVAGVPLDSVGPGEGEILEAWLSHAFYRELVLPGMAYQVGVSYRPSLFRPCLAMWVETALPPREIQAAIEGKLSELARAPFPSEAWETFRRRAMARRLADRSSTLRRDYEHCRDLGTGNLRELRPEMSISGSQELFARAKEEALRTSNWIFPSE